MDRPTRSSGLKREAPVRFWTSISPAYLHHVHPPPPPSSSSSSSSSSTSSPAMDPPRTRSRSRSGFYHFGMNGNVGSNGSGNAVSNGSMMNASGGGVSYPQQSNPGWAPHHGGRSYPDNQQQHTQGSYLSAGAQRHSSHGAHRHPGAGKQASVNRACSPARCIITHTHSHRIHPLRDAGRPLAA